MILTFAMGIMLRSLLAGKPTEEESGFHPQFQLLPGTGDGKTVPGARRG